MKRLRGDHGLSLVEVTIILLALTMLTGVMAPSIQDFVNDARGIKVKEDCEAIGLSIVRLMRDVGPCIRMNGLAPCSVCNRVDLLISEGHEVDGYAGFANSTYSATGVAMQGSGAGYGVVRTSYSAEGGSAESESPAGVNYVFDYIPRAAPSGTTWTNATRLGGSTAFYGPISSGAGLKPMVESAGFSDDIRNLLRESGIPEAADGVIAALSVASASAPASSPVACSSASPSPGTVVECQLQTGSTLEWMAYRPGARKGNRAPARLKNVRWAGKEPVRAFLFRVERDKVAYTFVVPAPCANLSLMSVADIRQRTVSIGGAGTGTVTSTGGGGRVITSTARTRYVAASQAGCYSQGGWSSSAIVNMPIGWYNTPQWAGTSNGHPNVDYIENQLIRNWPSGSPNWRYNSPGQDAYFLPVSAFNQGWRGAYLSSPIGDDPWGHKYFVNTMFLYAAGFSPGLAAYGRWPYGSGPGVEGFAGWSSDAFCLSAGRNGWVETPFASYIYPGTTYSGGTVRGGDDFVTVISGGTW